MREGTHREGLAQKVGLQGPQGSFLAGWQHLQQRVRDGPAVESAAVAQLLQVPIDEVLQRLPGLIAQFSEELQPSRGTACTHRFGFVPGYPQSGEPVPFFPLREVVQ